MDGMACPVCSLGGTLRSQNVTEAREHHDRTVVIHAVPAYVCDRCGTRAFDEATSRALEDVYDHASQDRTQFYVVRFPDLSQVK